MTEIRIEANGPFDHAAALALLAAHAVPGAQEQEGSVHRRIVTICDRPVVIACALDPGGVTATVDDPAVDPADLGALVARWFDLDKDIAVVDAALSADPALAPLIARRPGLRLIGHPGEFEAVATTIVGQQVSLAAARTFAGRLVAAHGVAIGDLRAFPTAAALAGQQVDDLRACAGLTNARAYALHAAARRWAGGPLLAGLDAVEARRVLLAMPGIGPWTADYLLVRALQHPDTFAPGDLVARRALGLNQSQAAERAEVWVPYRSYALLHLWTDAAYL